MDLIQKKKEALLSEKSGGVEKSDIQGRDLLSLLIKANLATDIPENMRMDDDDILAQVPTYVGVQSYTLHLTLSLLLGLSSPATKQLPQRSHGVSTH